jgi:spermidine/putrescine transport system permease protein
MKKRNNSTSEWALSFPSITWLLIFFLVPTCIIFAYAFKPADISGGVGQGWTLATIKSLMNSEYHLLILRTLFLSTLTTIICLALSLPIGYLLATVTVRMRRLLLLFIVVPFWTSFLIRIFAWKTLLHPEGAFKRLLEMLYLVDEQTTLLYNSGSVLLVMVYAYLPFAVFPIYAAASKFNFQLIEAALDLGATQSQAFFKVFIPGIMKGILSAMVMVFIPAVGAYVIPDLVGGTSSEMIGNKIAQKTFAERDLPQASALSALLAISILIPLLIAVLLPHKTRKIESEVRNRE